MKTISDNATTYRPCDFFALSRKLPRAPSLFALLRNFHFENEKFKTFLYSISFARWFPCPPNAWCKRNHGFVPQDVWVGVTADLSSVVSSIQEIFSLGIPEDPAVQGLYAKRTYFTMILLF